MYGSRNSPCLYPRSTTVDWAAKGASFVSQLYWRKASTCPAPCDQKARTSARYASKVSAPPSASL